MCIRDSPRGEGLGPDVDWRLKVFCPAFLQKSGRGPGAEPMAARRSARNSLVLTKRRRGSKGEPSPGVPPLRAAPAARSLCGDVGLRFLRKREIRLSPVGDGVPDVPPLGFRPTPPRSASPRRGGVSGTRLYVDALFDPELPVPPHFFGLAQRNGVEPQRKALGVVAPP